MASVRQVMAGLVRRSAGSYLRPMSKTIGLILAGGRSQRMGGHDKTFISLNGKPLLQHVIDRLAPQVDAMAISSNAAPQLFDDTGLPVIADIIGGFQGPLAGIHAGLMRYPDSQVISVAVDLPFLPADLVQRLKDGMNNCRCAYASNGVQHALAILWGHGMGNELEMFLRRGGRSIRDWLTMNGSPVFFEPDTDSDILLNVNSPPDLKVAEQRLGKKPDND